MEPVKAFFRRLFGYDYLLNKKTGEVHFIPAATFGCWKMEKGNRKYLTKAEFDKIKFRYVNKKYINGCRFCNKQNDKE